MNQIPRPEYPRPDFQREKWLPLNGEWDFSFDEPIFDQKILVPFACETKLSGIHDTSFHNAVWYRRSFSLPEPMHDRQILLHFGAVDYTCRLWVNDQFIREHTGGQCGFSADITDALRMSLFWRRGMIPPIWKCRAASSIGSRSPRVFSTHARPAFGRASGWKLFRRCTCAPAGSRRCLTSAASAFRMRSVPRRST